MILTKNMFFDKFSPKIFVILICQIGFIALTYSQSKPNVLMIVVDDLNHYIEGLEGHPQALTPNINVLANQGILFTNAHTNASLGEASRASFLTGLLPNTTQFYGNTPGASWRDNTIIVNSKTISEYFSEHGYATYKTGKVAYTEDDESFRWDNRLLNSLDYGPLPYNGVEYVAHPNTVLAYAETTDVLGSTVTRLSDIPEVLPDGVNSGYTGWWDNGKPFNYIDDDNRDTMPDEDSVLWTQNNIITLDAINSTDPFFMAVGLIRPHTPLVVPDKYFAMFPIEDVQIPVIRKHDRNDAYLDDELSGCKLFSVLDDSYTDRQEALRKQTQAYLAALAFADDMVGQILETLDNSSYADNTIVLLFGDNGYHLGEKQYVGNKTLWYEATRVPLIIYHPDYTSSAGEVVDHPVSLVDIYPTLQDFCNLTGDTKKSSIGKDLDGFSLKPFLENPELAAWDGPAAATTSLGVAGQMNPNEQNHSICTKKYRYTKYENGNEELYDHSHDPHEWKNLAQETDYLPVKTELQEAFNFYLEDQQEPNLILLDEMADDSKMLNHINWNFTNATDGNLVNDPEQIQRKNLNAGHLVYDATDAKSFKIDFWGLENQTIINYGLIKAYTATVDSVYTEIPVTYTESDFTGYRRLFHITPNVPVDNDSKYLRIVLFGGDATWKGLIGAVRLYDGMLPSKKDYNYIDDIAVNPDTSLFDFNDDDLRSNKSGMPSFTDHLNDTSQLYRYSSNFHFTSNPNASLYDNDIGRLVRNNNDFTDVELIYSINKLNYYRLEFWTSKNLSIEEINATTGAIKTYISNAEDLPEDYVEVPLKYVRIKINDGLIKYALVPEQEIESPIKYFKITITGGTGPMSGAQIGAIHFYDDSIYSSDNSLSTDDLDDEKIKSVTMYPNPTNDRLYFSGFHALHNVKVYTLTGQLLIEKETDHSIDVSALNNGLYFAKIDNQFTLQFIKKD